MRNNQDRLGVVSPTNSLQSSTDVPPTVEAMQFIVPTEAVDLPSKGLFYQEGHPLHGIEKVEIRHMTTKEEDILINESYLKNGTAIDKLLQSVLVAPKVNIRDMLIGDKNALTVACRIYGYGPEYTTNFVCPSCQSSQAHTFDLNDIEHKNYIDDLQEYNAEIDYERQMVVLPIPRTNVKLELKLLKEDDTEITKFKKNKNSFAFTKHYERLIYSVNGNSDKQYVRSYIASMSALDSRYLRAAYSKIIPGVDFICRFECSECNFEGEVEVPLNAEFFWPKT